ncbi:DUF4365 domain-containing protein [Streptomyces sp. NPDC093111]|uniref:DUF4365 domain-containing protein n=1 Tax=Streptomyces sp. NPDC093111 TaxID=3154978 RepID=UPI003414F960
MSWIEHLVAAELGWFFRPQDVADFGIDAHLEIVDADSGKPTGRLLGVQIKSGSSYFEKATENGWWFPCSSEHVAYWLGHSLPVVVMLYEPTAKRVYWQHVSDQTVVSTGKGSKIHVPRRNELSGGSVLALSPLARSKNDVPALGGWLVDDFGGPRRREFYQLLLSARLQAMFPECGISRREVDYDASGLTIHFLAYKGMDHVMIDVEVVTSVFDLAHRVSSLGSGRRYIPVVIVLVGQGPGSMPPKPVLPPVFVTHWNTDGRYDDSLRRTLDSVLTWIAGSVRGAGSDADGPS